VGEGLPMRRGRRHIKKRLMSKERAKYEGKPLKPKKNE
jgi:hypothetical protein